MSRVVPHTRELLADTLTPLAAYERLREGSPCAFLFESVTGGEQVSRYSFLGSGPRELLRLHSDRLERERDGVVERLPGPPLDALREQLGRHREEPQALPFTGGWVGTFGFDLVRLVERLPARPPDPFGLPVATLGRFDRVVVFDHVRQRMVAVAHEIDGEVTAAEAQGALDELVARLVEPRPVAATVVPEAPAAAPDPPAASLSGEEFRAAVERARQHIAAGDVFQVVLARRFRLAGRVAPRALYRALRTVNPSPYMVLLELPEVALVGASPEMLVRKTGRRLETRPIAGTRRRGGDAEEDRRLAAELLADAKERAEHLMLVDLGRNDLGRVAAAGTVRVPTFMEVERYSHVMHLVSSVEAEAAPGSTALDALLATFPAGTVSGAPKVRALEIIDELEPESRGPYAGAVGYLSHSGDLDTCITIRTLVLDGQGVSVTAGAGIVADSVPEHEQAETENKAAGLLAAVGLAARLAEAEAEAEGVAAPVAAGGTTA